MDEEDEDDQLVADGGQVRHRRELVLGSAFPRDCPATWTVPAPRGPMLLTRVRWRQLLITIHLVYPSTSTATQSSY